MQFCFHIIIYASQIKTLADALICILQVVFPDQSDMYLVLGIALLGKEVVPGFHGRCLTDRDSNLSHDGSIQSLVLHVYRYLIDAWHILALYHTFKVNVTK